ncbi:MAG: M28 family peptidase [Robiginitalea sp.]
MKFIAFFLGILLISFGCREHKTQEVTLQEDVHILASDSLMGRETGREGADMAAAYLEGRMRDLGLKPFDADGDYLQDFSFRPKTDPHSQVEYGAASDSSLQAKNLLGYIDNGGSRTVILGAHYDHLGMGSEGSLYRGESAIHNGADDNASGVATLLKLANMIREWPEAKDNYLIILFSGEETGLLGSNFFVKNPPLDLDQVAYMINLDMVGRLREDKTLSVSGTGTTPIWPQLLNSLNPGFKLVLNESGVGPSDHTSFYLQDIPVLHFFTGQHEDYHKPSDDAEKLNYEGMQEIANYLFDLVKSMESQEEIAFRKTKNESEETPRFKVTLGVIPDYLFSGEGMRIDGVSEDRPAQKAGLQKGDIVLQLGDSTIVDMMSYMRALSSFEEGQTTTVVVERNGEKVSAEVTF